jgi:hypothetical protein
MHWLFAPARIRFCECALDGPIKHPADVWTNIGPLLAGFFILARAEQPLERLLGLAAVWTGAASAYFHARSTILGEALDLSGLFLFILSLAALQQRRKYLDDNRPCVEGAHVPARRVGWGSHAQLIIPVLLLSFLLTCLSTLSVLTASPAFATLVVLVVLRECYSPYRFGRWGWALLVTFLLAWTFWWLDYLRVLCDPSNHLLTGHGVWHLLNGLVFWFTFKHFHDGRQIRSVTRCADSRT